jgi:CelD/BcsL family acetyltransferase involved in cellulose biosynthesis
MAGYSPGMLLMVRMIEVMPQHGLDTYDLGPSAENYKPYFASEVRRVANGVVGKKAGRVRSFVSAIPHAPLRAVAERVVRRMDHVAAAELTTLGRARGMLRAFSALRTRLDVAQKPDKDDPKDLG